jgi:hypothetical protein
MAQVEKKVSVEVSFNINDKPNQAGEYPFILKKINYLDMDNEIVWAKSVDDVQNIATELWLKNHKSSKQIRDEVKSSTETLEELNKHFLEMFA